MLIQVLIFTKDRPLQLKSLLESFSLFSLDKLDVHILYKSSSDDFSYKQLIADYPDHNWIREKEFVSDVLSVLKNKSEYTLFLVDDVIFTRKISLLKVAAYLSSDSNFHGCQLRLGRNIERSPNELIDDLPFIKWIINKSKSHWQYPFDLSSGIYKTVNISNIIVRLLSSGVKIKNPNYLESEVVNYFDSNPILINNKFCTAPYFSVCLILTVNRVQDDFKNWVDTTDDYSAATLNKMYLNNHKIDIRNYFGLLNTYPHWHADNLKFTKANLDIKLLKQINLHSKDPEIYYKNNKYKILFFIEYNKLMRKIKFFIEIYTPTLHIIYRKFKKK